MAFKAIFPILGLLLGPVLNMNLAFAGTDLCKRLLAKGAHQEFHGVYSIRYYPWAGSGGSEGLLREYELIASEPEWKPAGILVEPPNHQSVFYPGKFVFTDVVGEPDDHGHRDFKSMFGRDILLFVKSDNVDGSRDSKVSVVAGRVIALSKEQFDFRDRLTIQVGFEGGPGSMGFHMVDVRLGNIYRMHYSTLPTQTEDPASN